MSRAKQCRDCGANTPYIDWPLCERCHSVWTFAGRETTAAQCDERIAWEHRRAEKVGAERPLGWEAIVSAHGQAAKAYEWLRTKLSQPARPVDTRTLPTTQTSMKYRVEYDTLYTGGNYSHVGEFCTVDAVSDEDVPAAFSQQTQIDPIHIVHFTLVNED